ncbi:hypothetical protein BJY00DRAFT_85490 [Aspergillus carlsbadensis]|nr:hypothetical protein BJY00DRAFT_85490 [Aspergillus carlsbadensis]
MPTLFNACFSSKPLPGHSQFSLITGYYKRLRTCGMNYLLIHPTLRSLVLLQPSFARPPIDRVAHPFSPKPHSALLLMRGTSTQLLLHPHKGKTCSAGHRIAIGGLIGPRCYILRLFLANVTLANTCQHITLNSKVKRSVHRLDMVVKTLRGKRETQQLHALRMFSLGLVWP